MTSLIIVRLGNEKNRSAFCSVKSRGQIISNDRTDSTYPYFQTREDISLKITDELPFLIRLMFFMIVFDYILYFLIDHQSSVESSNLFARKCGKGKFQVT